MAKYNLQEASRYLKKSSKTIQRYIKSGRLEAERVKSDKGTLEYSFSQEALDNIKDTQDKRQDKRQGEDTNVLSILTDQLKNKDDQIKSLQETINSLNDRVREANTLALQAQGFISNQQEERLKLQRRRNIFERFFKL